MKDWWSDSVAGFKSESWSEFLFDRVLPALPGEGVVVGGLSRWGRAANAAEKAVEACCCFPAGTPVVTENGTTPIEKIKVGQLVRARDEKSGLTELKPVTQLFITRGKSLFQLTTHSADGVTASIEVTDNHPFWVKGLGWTNSANLMPGMLLQDLDNKDLNVVELKALGRTETTYNFTVADLHTYYAGPQKALVHNCTCFTAASALAKETVATAGNYRSLFQKAVGSIREGFQVHHSIPQKYEKMFADLGINIHENQWLRGVSPAIHSKITSEWAHLIARGKGILLRQELRSLRSKLTGNMKHIFSSLVINKEAVWS